MATINEFLPFADQSTANLIPYAEWVNAAKRLTGFVSGIAKSNEMNRVFAQGAQAGYAIAKFIERTLSEDVYVSDGERLADQFYRAIVQMSYRATPIGCILTFPVHVFRAVLRSDRLRTLEVETAHFCSRMVVFKRLIVP